MASTKIAEHTVPRSFSSLELRSCSSTKTSGKKISLRNVFQNSEKISKGYGYHMNDNQEIGHQK